jgi:hypothetical protein
MLGILLLAIGVFFIWVALRVVDQLTKIPEQLRKIRDRLPEAPGGGLRREGSSMQLGPFQIRPKIIVLSRGAYLRHSALGLVVGFFLCRFLDRSASPRTEWWVELAMAILAIVVATSTMTNRQPHFIDKDALIETFSDFLSEEPQGKR